MMAIEILVISTLIWLAWADGRSRMIPDVGIIFLLLCGLVLICRGELSGRNAILGLLALGIPVYLLSIFMRHGTAIGGGDVKLCAAIGFVLGPVYGYIAIYLSVLLLAICGLILRRKALPFAPFCLPAYCTIIIFRSVFHV